MSQLSLTYPGTVGFNGRENTKNILREHSVFYINSFHTNMYVAIAIGTNKAFANKAIVVAT